MRIVAGVALAFFNRLMQDRLSLEGCLHLRVAGETEPRLGLFEIDAADQAMRTVAGVAMPLANRLVDTPRAELANIFAVAIDAGFAGRSLLLWRNAGAQQNDRQAGHQPNQADGDPTLTVLGCHVAPSSTVQRPAARTYSSA